MKLAVMTEHKMVERIFFKKEKERLNQSGLTVSWPSEQTQGEEIRKLMENADVLITTWGSPKLEANLLDSAPGLKLVLHAAGSVKPVVSPELWTRGIRVSSAAEALSVGVAETALGFTIVSLKNMWNLAESTRNGGWTEGKEKIREVYGVRVGVIGAGRAGRHYIRLLQSFQVEVVVYDPTLSPDDPVLTSARQVSLEQLLAESDVVSIHAPSIPATDRMLNEKTLAMMKDDAVIINTARGTIIDEEALARELKKGRLFACLDVTNPEPPSQDHPFRHLPNVVLTPHIAGAVNNGLGRIGEYVADELESYLAGKNLRGEVLAEQLNQLA